MLFGPGHLLALAGTAVVAATLAVVVRRDPRARPAQVVRFGLAAFLVVATAAYLLSEAAWRPLSPWDFVPLQLCDFLILLAVAALLTLGPRATELLYFWSAGTLLAMLTPDLALGFPHPAFLAYFGLHGAVVSAAVVLVLGFGLRPAAGAPRRAFLALLAYAAVVGLVDATFRANFLYLWRKPTEPTLLDWLGPWPVYLVAVAAVALGLFLLMDFPFRRARARAARLAPPTPVG